jgi:pimeloyl-ACP methyl ester carboxylesterase
VDVTPKVDPTGRARIKEFMQENPGGFTSLEEAAEAIHRYLPHRRKPNELSGLRRNLRHRADGRWYWHWDPRIFEALNADSAAAEARFISAARRVSVPTLLIRGAESELVKPDHVRHFLNTMPHAEYVDVVDAAHMIAGDSNDAFNDAVTAFVGRFR